MAVFRIENWLEGMVDYNVPDATLQAILYNNGIDLGSDVAAVSEKQKDLSLADLYMWLATSSSSSTGEYVSDGGWQHQKAAKNVVDRAGLRLMAKRLYDKWDSPKADGSTAGGFTMQNLY